MAPMRKGSSYIKALIPSLSTHGSQVGQKMAEKHILIQVIGTYEYTNNLVDEKDAYFAQF